MLIIWQSCVTTTKEVGWYSIEPIWKGNYYEN